MCRNLLSESNPSDARPERAMENEIATLNTMCVYFWHSQLLLPQYYWCQ